MMKKEKKRKEREGKRKGHLIVKRWQLNFFY